MTWVYSDCLGQHLGLVNIWERAYCWCMRSCSENEIETHMFGPASQSHGGPVLVIVDYLASFVKNSAIELVN
jgi:hypothetical protein